MNSITTIAFATLAVACAWSDAKASPVRIDFEDVPSQSVGTTNLIRNGFQFSPTCHIDVGKPLGGTTMIGWDIAGCDFSFNLGYLGGSNPRDGSLFVNLNGASFSILNVEYLGSTDGSTIFRSSKGGTATLPESGFNSVDTWSFTGDQWKDVEWLSISGGGGSPNFWMDAITFTVPESGTLSLISLAAVAGLASRKRKALHGRR